MGFVDHPDRRRRSGRAARERYHRCTWPAPLDRAAMNAATVGWVSGWHAPAGP